MEKDVLGLRNELIDNCRYTLDDKILKVNYSLNSEACLSWSGPIDDQRILVIFPNIDIVPLIKKKSNNKYLRIDTNKVSEFTIELIEPSIQFEIAVDGNKDIPNKEISGLSEYYTIFINAFNQYLSKNKTRKKLKSSTLIIPSSFTTSITTRR